jgi:hypothetical protein
MAEIAASLRFLLAAGSVTCQMMGLDGGDHLDRQRPAAGTSQPEHS